MEESRSTGVARRVESPVGTLVLVAQSAGLTHLQFENTAGGFASIPTVESACTNDAVAAHLDAAEVALEAYFAGARAAFEDLTLVPRGTRFQMSVWKALGRIPYGETRSYGEIATAVDEPGSSRAVGTANNRNPIAIAIPCHRVIGADGRLTGYGGGLDRKRWLLEHEGVLSGSLFESEATTTLTRT